MTDQQSLDRRAAELCLAHNIPFVIYSLPGTAETRFYASLPDADGASRAADADGGDSFFISRFGADEPYMAGVRAAMDARGVMDYVAANPDAMFDAPREMPYKTSTVRASWNMALRNMRDRLRREGGKVVLSRHTSLFSSRALLPLAEEYMALNPANFGYVCFTPETGVWYGSTPELILETMPGGGYATMALAGTRWTTDSSEPWDAKNIAEHETVVRYITSVLEGAGLSVTHGERHTVVTNGVEHLCTPLTATGDIPFGELLPLLNPTPAVAGVPLDRSLCEIDLLESHQRRCYAGVVGVTEGGRSHAYVNLRCAFAAPAANCNGRLAGWTHNVYAGGGIMPDSDEETEWAELEHKSHTLLSLIDGGMPDPDVVYNPAKIPFMTLTPVSSEK